MVNIGGISSPLLLIGVLYYLGENKEEWVGMEGTKIVAGGFGVASTDWATTQVRNVIGTDVSDEIAGALGGALMVKYGDKLHGVVPNVGRGVLLGVVSSALQESGMTLQDLIGDLTGNGSIIGGGNGSSPESTEKEPVEPGIENLAGIEVK